MSFVPQSDGIPLIIMAPAPGAVLDYTEDWAAWLGGGETITSATFAVPAGITKNSSSFTSTTAIVWLQGATLGQTYLISCTITTNQARTDTRSFRVRCVQR